MGRRAKGRRVHGILLLDKSPGGSSNKALQQVKRLFGAQKAGHTGSLDPLATGMLPICFGEATKLSAFLLDADKGYETTLKLGVTTDSGDADGDVIDTAALPTDLDAATFNAACARFVGPQMQIPPMVSAIKIDGQRLYKLARQGITVARPPRPVTIHKLDVLEISGDTARLSVTCSKGTYIRSLVTDIGDVLGCGAHVVTLRRTFVSPFEGLEMASINALEALVENGETAWASLDALLLPLDAGLAHLPAVHVADGDLPVFQQGQAVSVACGPDAPLTESDAPLTRPEGDSTSLWRVYSGAGQLLGLGSPVVQGEGETLHIAPRRVIQWD
jgi:tRNA pseudouridine55 synthase